MNNKQKQQGKDVFKVNGKLIVSGGAVYNGAKIKHEGLVWTYHDKTSPSGEHFACTDAATGDYYNNVIIGSADGTYNLYLRRDRYTDEPMYPIVRYTPTMELDTPVNRILRQHIKTHLRKNMVQVVKKDEDMRASMQGDVRHLEKNGASPYGFTTDGVIERTDMPFGHDVAAEAHIKNATFCISYSLREIKGQLVRYIDSVQIRNQESVSPVVFEKALNKVLDVSIRPEVQITAGSAAPEPGGHTAMEDALEKVHMAKLEATTV